uniref:uroporphyrinogen-III C-methyltransferase n=1 Tax=uncultured sulfate-reducing bacterium TaxID=153939 RepID=Q3IBM6_9BACT|nr:uroporphyrinogen III synthase/methyltransferase [uncultured sulfate-reducing bacterium]
MNYGNREGKVYLVGAGPGNPDLITVRARQVLDRCDAVVYDSLIPDELLVTLPLEVDRRYVGKKAGKHSLPQQEINDLLVRLASQGKHVVRLKGGDPFVFGRGAEEATYLQEHGIPYEIVPGITSGVAALSFSGIPCTDRLQASYVMFLTGHQAVEKAVSTVPWSWVAGARDGTLVIYMGVSEIESIVGELVGAGMSPDTPSAVVERGTISTQRALTAKLSELPRKVAESAIRPPALFVIGEVVKYHETLKWFQDRPLFGVRVMVTRPADQSVALYGDLRELGAEVLAYPTLATVEDFRSDDWDALRRIQEKERWVVFTSENGVRYFLEQWFATIGDIRGLNDYRIAAAGDGTARSLNANNLAPDFVPTRASMAALAQQMAEKVPMSKATVVRVRGNARNDPIERALRETGAQVVSLPVYRTFPTKWRSAVKEKLFAYPPDVILFTSGTAVDGLAANLSARELKELSSGAAVVSIGPATSRTIRTHGITVELESKVHTMPSLLEELVAHHRTTPLLKEK